MSDLGGRQVGSVRLESEPEGALIFENGVFTGHETNVTLTDVAVGRHIYELQFDCYDDSEVPHKLVVHVKAGEEVVHFVDMGEEPSAGDNYGDGYGDDYGDGYGAGYGADGSTGLPPTGRNLADYDQGGRLQEDKPIYIGDESANDEKVLTQSNVSTSKRIAAAFIDFYFIGVLLAVMGSIIHPLGGGMMSGFYTLLRDGLFSNGQSIGKMAIGFHVRGPGGRACTLEDSAIRNWPLALTGLICGFLGFLGLYTFTLFISMAGTLLFFLEFILVCTDSKGLRLGDRFAGTITRQGNIPYGRLTEGKQEPPMLT